MPLNLTFSLNLIPGVLQWVHNYRNYWEIVKLINPGIKTLIYALDPKRIKAFLMILVHQLKTHFRHSKEKNQHKELR